MANGFLMQQYQPLDYRPLIAGAGAPAAGFMGGIQQGMQLRQQVEELRTAEAERQAVASQATLDEQKQLLMQQASQGDPQAMEALTAMDPKAALQMQQITGLRQEQQFALSEEERTEVGALGSLLVSGSKDMTRSTYERAVQRVRKAGDNETDVGLPTRAEADEMSDDELFNSMQDVGKQMEAFGLGPQKAAAPLVQVGVGAAQPPFKVPAGYMLKDPNDPNKGVKPIPGTELEKKVKVGKFTEGQTTAARYAYNMVGATDAIDMLEGEGVTGAGFFTALKRGAGAVGQYAMSPSEQQYVQAQNDWIAAKLRKESGAAIPPEELEAQRKIYFPMPGDSNAVVKQKGKSRKRAQKGMIAASQGAYKSLFKDATPEELAVPAEGAPGGAPQAGQVIDWGSL